MLTVKDLQMLHFVEAALAYVDPSEELEVSTR
jgi:hypothetical protein